MADPIRLPVDTDEGNVQLTVEEMRVVEAVSPTVTAERDENGVMITVHDLNGTRTAHVNDGETGEAGRGIVSTTLNQDYTLSITFTDGTTWTSPMPIRGATGNGIASTTLNQDYTLSVTFTDGTTWTSPMPIRGATGTTPDMSIGTVQTLPAGSQATAEISGTAEQPVLSLGIPKGDPGSVPIDDTAGAGDTTKVWSADKTAGEVSDLKSAINDISEELYVGKDVTYNRETNPLDEIEGTIDSNGNVVTVLAGYKHTELVEVKPGSTVNYTGAWAYATYCVVACYDINHNFLAGSSKIATVSGEQSGTFQLNSDVCYISLMIYANSPVYTLQVTQSESNIDEITESINDINEEIESIQTNIEDISSELYVIRNEIHNKSVNPLSFTLGSIMGTGEISTVLSNYYYSEKISVVPGTSISYKNLIAFSGWCRIAAYDTSEAFLSNKSLLAESTGFDTGTWTVPDGVAFVSVVAFDPANETEKPYEVAIPTRIPISEVLDSVGSAWSGKTAVILGDSITAGLYTPTGGTEGPDSLANPTYWETAAQLTGATFIGYGESGSSISRTSPILPNQAMSIRYLNMTDEADLIVVAGGTNDYGTNVALGSIADQTDISFYGALNVLCDGLQTKYPGKRIVFITPIHRANEEANQTGATLEQYRQAIYDVARDVYGFAVIDGKTMGISCKNASFKNVYIYDGLHPTQQGHNLYGQCFGHALNGI